MKKIISILFISLLFISCKGQTEKAIQTIDVKAFAQKLQTTKNPQLLDVRTPQEYAVEHIGDATNVNWNSTSFVLEVEKYDKTKPVFVYCKVGGRSAQAADKLAQLGFTTIYNLDGGMMKWNASGMAQPNNKIIGMCNQEFNELLKSNKKVMVNFYAEWCAPCKKMSPYIIKMQDEMKDKVNIVRLDADKNKTLVEALKLDGLPVIILYENGKEIWRNIGYITEEDLKKHL
ncbi:Thioredoxin family protein [Flavobacterium psychrophilum]|uniref:thioredoxin domain-containing protein n=1 Tax=Flavobacterium psychrophilum TaxID=96345 RepID=UPI000B7C0F40|nr:thioredoxin domain-containing protein [Flavobacterium psychrophilum]ELI6454111.1 thioredoxin fold domain-containing protein [Flavobacterium psychrophilum]SNB16639.1 Thioredoxin family protein [Flavobacterium psychrophilum]